MHKTLKALLASAVFSLGLATAAHAQDATQGVTPIKPSEAQLNNYVKAAQKVTDVAGDYQTKFDQAGDEDARQKVLNEANQKMVEAVEQSGMSLEEYNGISMAVQEDPQLRQTIESRVTSK